MTLRTLLALAVMIATPFVALAQHATTAQEGYKEANDKMMQDMMMPMSGDADKDFVMLMLRHHQGAIDMAQVELKYGKDPMLLDMAKKIVEAQEKEIAEMKKWQAENP
jgi:uncharacterized protein (DUF305 family)